MEIFMGPDNKRHTRTFESRQWLYSSVDKCSILLSWEPGSILIPERVCNGTGNSAFLDTDLPPHSDDDIEPPPPRPALRYTSTPSFRRSSRDAAISHTATEIERTHTRPDNIELRGDPAAPLDAVYVTTF